MVPPDRLGTQVIEATPDLATKQFYDPDLAADRDRRVLAADELPTVSSAAASAAPFKSRSV
jgi:hypothetical protein